MKLEGMDEIMRNFDRLKKKAKAISGTTDIPIRELLPPGFMASHTPFGTAQAMLDAAGNTKPGDPQWDEFIGSNTHFQDWDSMLEAAVGQWTKGRLGL